MRTASRVNPALLIALTLSACGAPGSRTPPLPSPPPARDLQGTVQDNAGRPLAGSLSVTLDPYEAKPTVSAGADGRFAFKGVSVGRHRLSVLTGGQTLYLRLASGSAERELSVEFDLPVGSGSFGLGTLYAESHQENENRIAKAFGPYCTRAVTKKPLGLPEEHMPLRLDRIGRDQWRIDATFEPAQLPGVAAVCKQVTMDEVGRYSQSGDPAYNYTWDLVVVRRDGKTLSQKFAAPAPQQAPTGQFGVDTGQRKKLRTESAAWLAEALK